MNQQRKNITRESRANMDMENVGKLPPQVVEMEEAVLGALLLDPFHLPTISTRLKPEYFYREQHGRIYAAILNLFNKSKTVDILTVTQELKRTGDLELVGGAYFVSSITNRIANGSNIESHALHVHEKYILRECIRIGTTAVRDAYSDSTDPFELIDSLTKQLAELTNIINNNVRHVGDVFNDLVQDIRNVHEHGHATGMLSGLENIDDQTGGWQNGNLIVLAARPGMGKTALALALGKYPAIHLKKPVAIFSLEMSAKELVGRLAASESDINATKINQKKIDRLELQTMGGRCFKLIDSPIYIDDTSNIKFSDLKARAKKLKYEKKIELIIIDYLQLMHGDQGGNREQEISYITRNLKALAKELDLPIILLSQLSRKVEERTGANAKRPQLSDLRESGAIEQDADMVAFLFRPEYYGMFENGYEYGFKTLSTNNLMLFDIAKGRGVQICEVPIKFFGEFMICTNYDLKDPEPLTPLLTNNNFLE